MPLHVGRYVGAAVLECADVIRNVTGTRADRLAGSRAGMRIAKFTICLRVAQNASVGIARAALASLGVVRMMHVLGLEIGMRAEMVAGLRSAGMRSKVVARESGYGCERNSQDHGPIRS